MELDRRKLRDHVYYLTMTSFGVIALFLAAVGWFWWGNSGFLIPSSSAPVWPIAVTASGYLVIRVLLFRMRRKLKKFRKN